LKQNITFLEHELETTKKNCATNLKTHHIILKNLENQNNDLYTERSIALKHMELLEVTFE